MVTQSKLIRLYVVEEQELYRELYKSLLSSRGPFELLRLSINEDFKSISNNISTLSPDVLLLSTKRLSESTVAELERIRLACPRIGIVLLLVFYNAQDIELVRRLALTGKGGVALFLKQSLDHSDQLFSLIKSVSQGQIILDPMLSGLLLANNRECPFLKQLTARELEILALLAKGFTNSAIANSIFIDVKTVEHHINNMYSKLKSASDFNHKHPRVSAARMYLEATGELVSSVS